MTVKRIRTATHRAMSATAGVDVDLDERGKVTRWKLSYGGVWTAGGLQRVRALVRDALADPTTHVETICAHAYLTDGDTCAPCGKVV